MPLPGYSNKDQWSSREEIINQTLSSIAMEGFELSKVINAEAEKLERALGTIQEASGQEKALTVDELLELSGNIHKTLNRAAGAWERTGIGAITSRFKDNCC